MPKYPVFVVGSPRSGTSILVDALFSAGYKGFREGSFLSLITGIDAAVDKQFRTFDDGNKAVLISNIDKDALKERLHDVLKIEAAVHQQVPWFDKTGNPEMIQAIPALRRLWPESVFIFAKRRAIENVMSRVRKFPKHSFEYHCTDWTRNMAAWRSVRATLPSDRYVEIDQQDMIRRPVEAASRLCVLLGLTSVHLERIASTFQSNRPQQTEANSAARLVSLSATGWSETQCEIFRKQCETEMAEYGYSIDEGYAIEAEVA